MFLFHQLRVLELGGLRCFTVFSSGSFPKVKEVVMKLWSPITTVFYRECWDVLGFGVLVSFPREAGLHHGLGSYETATPNR